MKKALILGGGAARGAFQAKVIQTLLRGNRYDFIAGTSAGALNGLLFSQGRDLLPVWEGLQEGACRVYKSRAIREGRLSLLGALTMIPRLIRTNSIADFSPLHNLIYVKLDKPLTIPLIFGCVSVSDSRYHAFEAQRFSGREELAKALLAASSMPILAPPVSFSYQARTYNNMIDGGIATTTPVSLAVKKAKAMGGDWHLDVISCSPNQKRIVLSEVNPVRLAFAVQEAQRQAIIKKDMGLLEDRNALPGFQNFSFSWYRPQAPLAGSLDFSREALLYNQSMEVFKVESR